MGGWAKDYVRSTDITSAKSKKKKKKKKKKSLSTGVQGPLHWGVLEALVPPLPGMLYVKCFLVLYLSILTQNGVTKNI